MAGKFTVERAQLACDERRKGATIRACATAAGITHVTLHAWINRGTDGRAPYAEFKRCWDKAGADFKAEQFERLRMSA